METDFPDRLIGVFIRQSTNFPSQRLKSRYKKTTLFYQDGFNALADGILSFCFHALYYDALHSVLTDYFTRDFHVIGSVFKSGFVSV